MYSIFLFQPIPNVYKCTYSIYKHTTYIYLLFWPLSYKGAHKVLLSSWGIGLRWITQHADQYQADIFLDIPKKAPAKYPLWHFWVSPSTWFTLSSIKTHLYTQNTWKCSLYSTAYLNNWFSFPYFNHFKSFPVSLKILILSFMAQFCFYLYTHVTA